MDSNRKATDLPEGDLATDVYRADGTLVHSLTAHALQAIERYAQQDRSNRSEHECNEEWITKFYKGWARARLLEHYYGMRCWSAFGERNFALFRRSSLLHHVEAPVLEEVAELLAQGGENLDIIDWAMAEDRDLDPILWLLDRVDINAQRQRLLTDHIRMFLNPGNDFS